MDDQKQQLIDKLAAAANILVTVSSNPSVDQLAACIGLTLALNKLDKHATAVFSGNVPETIEFLKPEETLEKNTDSLRDFIIALDKSKADKLRYKVEDKVVKIFITPYRTSIGEEDLNFSQGDFNVDVVLALGVKTQQDLDQAITAHGRILHDATVLTVSIGDESQLGSINWRQPKASSLSELSTIIIKQLDKKLLDGQIATALLTGIVAATDRFRDDNTTAATMSISADLMSAGANQQLVTSELEHSVSLRGKGDGSEPISSDAEVTKSSDGTLQISHQDNEPESPPPPPPPPPEPPKPEDSGMFKLPPPVEEHEPPQIHEVHAHPDENKEPEPYLEEGPSGSAHGMMTEPPTFGGALTAVDKGDESPFEPSPDMVSDDDKAKLLSHNSGAAHPDESSSPSEPSSPSDDESKEPDEGVLNVAPAHADESPAPDEPEAPAPPPETPQPAAPEPPTPGPAAAAAPEPPAATPPPEPFMSPPSAAGPPLSAPPPTGPAPDSSTPPPPSEPPATPAAAAPPTGGEPDVEAARNEVMRALSEQPEEALPPIAALNAQPLGEPLHADLPPASPPPAAPAAPAPEPPGPAMQSPADQPLDMPLPPGGGVSVPAPQTVPPTNSPAANPNAPPPVPPPMMPPTFK